MTKKQKDTLQKRLKSLAWSTGMMLAAVVVDFLMENIGLFGLPNELTVFIGLVLAQISKYLNSK